MIELDINKATGPDNLGNLVYTNLAKLDLKVKEGCLLSENGY